MAEKRSRAQLDADDAEAAASGGAPPPPPPSLREVHAMLDAREAAHAAALAALAARAAAEEERAAAAEERVMALADRIADLEAAAAARARPAAEAAARAPSDAGREAAAADGAPGAALRCETREPRIDIIGLCVANRYLEVGEACAGLCRETWTTVPPGLSEADAARVRAGHPIWPHIINLKHGKYKMTRLGSAALEGELSRARELCDWRAGIEEADNDGRTPLWSASCNGYIEVVRELLACGANIEAATNDGFTSLYVASQEGHIEVVRELLNHGAFANAATDGAGFTPLIHASYLGHAEVVRALLAAGADKRCVTINGETAASLAGNGARDNIIKVLSLGPDEPPESETDASESEPESD
jgi:hypothetical protein